MQGVLQLSRLSNPTISPSDQRGNCFVNILAMAASTLPIAAAAAENYNNKQNRSNFCGLKVPSLPARAGVSIIVSSNAFLGYGEERWAQINYCLSNLLKTSVGHVWLLVIDHCLAQLLLTLWQNKLLFCGK